MAIAKLPSTTSNPVKRKYDGVPSNPSGVIDALFSSDNSNDSWVVTVVGSSVSSPPDEHHPLIKKSRVEEQQTSLPLLSRVVVDIVGSPR